MEIRTAIFRHIYELIFLTAQSQTSKYCSINTSKIKARFSVQVRIIQYPPLPNHCKYYFINIFYFRFNFYIFLSSATVSCMALGKMGEFWGLCSVFGIRGLRAHSDFRGIVGTRGRQLARIIHVNRKIAL